VTGKVEDHLGAISVTAVRIDLPGAARQDPVEPVHPNAIS